MSAKTECVTGIVESVIYQNEENGYSVCDIEDENGDLLTAVGIMPYIASGDRVKLCGEYINHKTYGKQFKVENYEKFVPTGKDEILRYLSSGAIKGVGPKTAEKIVEIYGDESFSVLSEHPEWLVRIKGISRAKALEIGADFKEKTEVREILSFCKDKMPVSSVMKIYKKWGKNALNMIKENPYSLCSSAYGISFKRADEIALSMGVDKDSTNRIKSSLRYCLDIFASRDGHTFVGASKLIDASCAVTGADTSVAQKVLSKMDDGDGIHFENKNGEKAVFLKENYDSEKFIARKLLVLNKRSVVADIENIYSLIDTIEAENGIKYAKLQRRAIKMSLSSGVTVLTGGPGTGKTTVIKALIAIFDKIGMRCALCAPTGRAAKRMSEATSTEAKTIHRLLEPEPDGEEEVHFLRNEHNLLEKEVIIVDEASMIDIWLMQSLLRAIKPGAKLILIGDINQLPSVGCGNVLKDIINSECFGTVCLNEIFRQSEGSGIVVNAHLINEGKYPDFTEKSDDFFFASKKENEIPEYIASLCSSRIPKKFGKTIFDGIQIITPSKKGETGTANLNLYFQKKLNPESADKKEMSTAGGRIFRCGDKVMQIRNNYEIEWQRFGVEGNGIFNGEIGIVVDVSNDEITVNFDDKLTKYSMAMLIDLEHSYAITVHKSQGSEYPIVIIPLSQYAPMLLTRNLLYTAITRAEQTVILVGDKNILYQMVDNNAQIIRNTALEEFLRHEKKAF